MLGSLIALLMSYYIFYLNIPPRHTMALSVFEAIVLEEPQCGTMALSVFEAIFLEEPQRGTLAQN